MFIEYGSIITTPYISSTLGTQIYLDCQPTQNIMYINLPQEYLCSILARHSSITSLAPMEIHQYGQRSTQRLHDIYRYIIYIYI